MAKQISFPLRNKTLHSNPFRVANCALWFLKLPHSEAKKQVIVNVNILGGSLSVIELLETIGNSVRPRLATSNSAPDQILTLRKYALTIVILLLTRF